MSRKRARLESYSASRVSDASNASELVQAEHGDHGEFTWEVVKAIKHLYEVVQNNSNAEMAEALGLALFGNNRVKDGEHTNFACHAFSFTVQVLPCFLPSLFSFSV